MYFVSIFAIFQCQSDIKFCANIQTKSKPIFYLTANNICLKKMIKNNVSARNDKEKIIIFAT